MFLECSERWSLTIDEGSGITLKQVKQEAMEGSNAQILSAKVREGTPGPIEVTVDSASHSVSVGRADSGPEEWFLRLGLGVTFNKALSELEAEPGDHVLDRPLLLPAQVAFVSAPSLPVENIGPGDLEDF